MPASPSSSRRPTSRSPWTTSRMPRARRSTSSGPCSTSTGSTSPRATSPARWSSRNGRSSSASPSTSRWSRRGSNWRGRIGTTPSPWSKNCPRLPHARCVALTVAGTVKLRRGDDGADDDLDEARRLADELGELQRRGPVAAARAEAALLRGDLAAARAIARPEFDEADRLVARSLRAELAYLLRARRRRRSRSRPTTSIRSPSRRAATGGAPPISGEQPDVPTTRPRRSPRAPTRPTCSRRSRSSIASARYRSPAGCAPNCAIAGCGTSRAAPRT